MESKNKEKVNERKGERGGGIGMKGIDETSTMVGEGARTRRVADVSRHWALRFGAEQPFPAFSPPRTTDAEALRPFDEALRHAAVALAALGAADFRAFWSTLVTVDAPGRFVAGLLRACPHAWCAHTPRARALLARPPLRGAVLGARDVVVRALCRAESAAACVSAPAHAQYLRALGWTDAPALIAACALFGPLAPNPCDEDAFVRAVRALLADEPLVARPLLAECAKIAPAIIATLSLDDSTKKEEKEEDDDNEMDSLLDAVATLAAFFRVATVCTAPFVRAGLFPQLSRCYAAVSARLMQGDATTPAAATATDVLRAIEACAASALMFAWLAVFAGASEHVPPPAAADMEESNSEDTKDKEAAREKMRREAATGLLAFVRTAGDTTEGALVRALDDRCDLGARVRALAAQHRDVFPRADVDAALRALGRSTATTSSGGNDEEAFPALPTTGVDQLLSLFPGADIAKLEKALAACGGRVEDVVARVCEGGLDVQPDAAARVAEAPGLAEPLAEGSHLVVLHGRGGGHRGDVESSDGSSSSKEEREEMKDAILARLARMEEEEERERVRRYEAQRLRRSAGAADVYADDYDDSFDDFVRYDFQDGEELGDGDSDDGNGDDGSSSSSGSVSAYSAAAKPAAKPAAQPAVAPQSSGGRGGGRGGRRGGRGKNHHQSDRAMNKRNRGMVPIART